MERIEKRESSKVVNVLTNLSKSPPMVTGYKLLIHVFQSERKVINQILVKKIKHEKSFN